MNLTDSLAQRVAEEVQRSGLQEQQIIGSALSLYLHVRAKTDHGDLVILSGAANAPHSSRFFLTTVPAPLAIEFEVPFESLPTYELTPPEPSGHHEAEIISFPTPKS